MESSPPLSSPPPALRPTFPQSLRGKCEPGAACVSGGTRTLVRQLSSTAAIRTLVFLLLLSLQRSATTPKLVPESHGHQPHSCVRKCVCYSCIDRNGFRTPIPAPPAPHPVCNAWPTANTTTVNCNNHPTHPPPTTRTHPAKRERKLRHARSLAGWLALLIFARKVIKLSRPKPGWQVVLCEVLACDLGGGGRISGA